MENNLLIYNSLKEVPEEAKKPITGGRLKGMTDIKPMWRIQKLTEVFGPVGLGWFAPITNKEIIEGANGEKIAIVDINLFVNYKKPLSLEEDTWSEAITGTGGSSFIANEKSGLYTSDECFKMAYTDALSVACKSLGMGADVYWGDSEYDTKEEMTLERAQSYVFNFGKHKGKKLIDVINDAPDYIDWLLDGENTDKDLIKAIELLSGQAPNDIKDDNEKLKLISTLNTLVTTKKVDYEKLLAFYKVDSNAKMTVNQLKEAIKQLEGREDK